MCCSEVVIIGGGVPASAAPPGPIRVRPGDSQSTTTRQRLLATYNNTAPGNRNLSVNNLRPPRELTFAPGMLDILVSIFLIMK